MADEQNEAQETFVCTQCGKEKKMSEPHYEQGGDKYCCEECCGKDSEETCEFC